MKQKFTNLIYTNRWTFKLYTNITFYKNNLLLIFNWRLVVNIIITSLILITLMLVKDSLLIRLNYWWDPQLVECMHAGVKKGCSMLRIPVSNWGGRVIYSLMMCIFSLNILILNVYIFICANYKLIILLLLSIWFSTTLTKNFWSKHTLNSNSDFFTRFLVYVSDSTKFIPILISLTITIIIVFISRTISRAGVCFLLGGIGSPSIDTLSFSLMILLSWPLLWYIVNIMQKAVKREKLSIVDFEFCNPYVVEKVNLYGITLNLFINYLADTNLYLLGLSMSIIVGFVYIMVKYGDLMFMVYVNNHNRLHAEPSNWELMLTLAGLVIGGLEETVDWTQIPARKVFIHPERQEYRDEKGCWNIYIERNNFVSKMQKNSPDLALYHKERSILQLRARVFDHLKNNYETVPFGTIQYNTCFSSDTLIGFSVNTLRTRGSNAVVLFIKERDNNDISYYPSFFHDKQLQITKKDLLDKYGIFINEAEKMEYLILFTQYKKEPDSSLIKVWKPLSYSHMPFTDSRMLNYFCHDKPIMVGSPLFSAGTDMLTHIKDLSLKSWAKNPQILDELKTNIQNLTNFYLLTSCYHGGGFLDREGIHYIGYNSDNSKHSYHHFHGSKWESKLSSEYKNNEGERVPSYKEAVVEHVIRHHLKEKIFLTIQDKLYIEPHVLIKEGEGTKLYSIIDTSNLFRWNATGDIPLTLYKDGYNVLDNEDNTSLIRILAHHFKFQEHTGLCK